MEFFPVTMSMEPGATALIYFFLVKASLIWVRAEGQEILSCRCGQVHVEMAANRCVNAGSSRKGLRVIDPRSSWAVPWFQALPGDVNSVVFGVTWLSGGLGSCV